MSQASHETPRLSERYTVTPLAQLWVMLLGMYIRWSDPHLDKYLTRQSYTYCSDNITGICLQRYSRQNNFFDTANNVLFMSTDNSMIKHSIYLNPNCKNICLDPQPEERQGCLLTWWRTDQVCKECLSTNVFRESKSAHNLWVILPITWRKYLDVDWSLYK